MKKIFRTMILMVVGIAILTGCGTKKDNGFINNFVYENEEFWEGEELSIVTNIKIKRQEVGDNIEDCSFSDLSEEQKEKVKKLRKAISKFFKLRYGIELSDRLEKQKVTFYSTSDFGESVTMGYVDINDSDTLHLNIALNEEYKELFESTYVHETLHQLGFQDAEMTFVVEGIVDAYTDLILTEGGINSQPTDIYFETRQLGYQMIKADEQLPKVFLEKEKKETVKEHINRCLNQYKQEYVQHKDLAGYLNDLMEALIAINSGTGFSENAYYYAYDSQAIVQRYCQAQECKKSTIQYIRKHYLIDAFEDIEVIDQGGGVYSLM